MQGFLAEHTIAVDLAAALMLGALIGLERGWRDRDRPDGSRVAGLRTFSLVGLFGGVLGVLHPQVGAAPIAAGLLGLAALAVVTYREHVRIQGGLSATTAVALLLSGSLGVLAGVGQALPAISAAVIVAVVLSMKPTLHRWLHLVEQRELSAALQLLVLSMVILPLLPDEGFGPYDAINPSKLWWAVVLVAVLSLTGHLAVRLAGPQRGIFWFGLLGGMASSTAATLALARQARDEPQLAPVAAAGALAANAMMFVRMALIASLMQPALLWPMGVPMLAAALVLLAIALWQRRLAAGSAAAVSADTDPFDLGTALGFGVLLGVLAVLTEFVRERLGATALYGLALISGLVDVDAILLAMMRMVAVGTASAAVAITAASFAAAANMVMKAFLAGSIGGAAMGRRVALGYLASLLAVMATALIVNAAGPAS